MGQIRTVEGSPLPQAEKIEFAYIGNPEVLQTFAHHAALHEKGQRNAQDNARWIIYPGGGTKGALQSGLQKAAIETGFFYGATAGIGMSVGSAVLIEGAAGNSQASSIFYEDNPHNGFIRHGLRNILKGEFVSFKALEQNFRNHPMSIERLRTCPVPLLVGIMPQQGDHAGEVEFVDARFHPDAIQLLMASMNLPWIGDVKTTALEHGGQELRCNDGGLSEPYAISYAIEHGARDILLMMNEKFDAPAFMRFLARVRFELGKRDTNPIRRAVLQSLHKGIIDMDKAYSGKIILEDGTEVRIGVIAPTKNRVKFLEENWQLLRRAVFDSADEGFRIFGPLMQAARQKVADMQISA